MIEAPLGTACARDGSRPVRRRRDLRLRHALLPAWPDGRLRRRSRRWCSATRSRARSWRSPARRTGLKVGDRVAVNPSRWCGHCARCREGRPNLCENIYFMGSASKTPHMQGGFASLLRRDSRSVREGFGRHALVGGGARRTPCGLPACRRPGRRGRGPRGIVFGAGPIGLLTLLAARLAGMSEIAVVDVAAAPLAFAQRLGADHVIDISAGDEASAELAASAALRRRLRGFRNGCGTFLRDPASCAAAARSCRSATCRAAASPCPPTPSWRGKSISRARFGSAGNSSKPSRLIDRGTRSMFSRSSPRSARSRELRRPSASLSTGSQSVKVVLTAH